jgi:hypothetical protein
MKKIILIITVCLISFTSSAQVQQEDVVMNRYKLRFQSANGGSNRIQSFGNSYPGTWLFKSRFDNIVLDAGENEFNRFQILFKTGNIERARFTSSGNFGIGSSNPDEKLTVKGKIHAEEVRVDLNVPADYVFQKYYTGASLLKETYKMPTLEEVAAFTKKNHHLPEVPSAAQIQKEGLHLKQMTNLLLQKIEELTIYTIEQEKRINALESKLVGKKS